MRSKGTILFVLLAAALVMGLGSCAKKQGVETPVDRLLGRWKLYMTATDDNADGIIENSEKRTLPEGQDYERIFNNDATGVETNVYNKIVSPPLKFHWVIVGVDSVRLEYAANDTVTYFIDRVSSSDISLITKGPKTLEWYYYVKK